MSPHSFPILAEGTQIYLSGFSIYGIGWIMMQ